MTGKLYLIKNPILIIGLFIFIMGLFFVFKKETRDQVIGSDGSGYYAYLPALLLYKDGSFEQSAAAEKKYTRTEPLYLYKTKDGKTYNKYFPGVAVLQLPGFIAAWIAVKFTSHPADGYSAIFKFSFYFNALLYAFLGLFFFCKVLQQIFGEQFEKYPWIVIVIYCTTPLLYTAIDTPSNSHIYSFFLFALFAWQTLRLKSTFSSNGIFVLGLITGMIFLVRPTNLVVVIMLPFLLETKENTTSFFKTLFRSKFKNLSMGFLGLTLPILVLLLSWKWQTGRWILWSYSGEGFNWLHPAILQNLFSFRSGIIWQSPIMLFAFAGVIYMWKNNPFKTCCWILYFGLNLWIISAWWCWDFESNFGNRPLTEHFLFLLLPLFYLPLNKSFLLKTGLIILALIGIIRWIELREGYMSVQRFTKDNYFKSLVFWKKENKGRWNLTNSVVPFGKRIESDVLLSQDGIIRITPEQEFSMSAEKSLRKNRSNERYYYYVTLERKLIDPEWKDIFLVVDAYNSDMSKRYYRPTNLFNDKLAGKKDWEKIVCSGTIYDNFQELEYVKIYLWNPSGTSILIKNINISLELYKAP